MLFSQLLSLLSQYVNKCYGVLQTWSILSAKILRLSMIQIILAFKVSTTASF
jgi:hypothetical protein